MAEILVPSGAAYGPMMILGLPWYIWAIVALGVALMLVIGLFIWYWWTMGPCGPYFRAARKGTDLGLIGMKSGRMKFVNLDYLAGVFRELDLKLSWLQRSKESWRFGQCNAKLVCDMWGIATEPKIQQAVKTAVLEHNAQEKIAEDTAALSGFEYDPDYIYDYASLYDAVKEGQIKDPVLIPAVYEVPVWEIRHFLAEIGPGDLNGHVDARLAQEKGGDKSAMDVMKIWMPIMLMALLIVCAIYLLFGSGIGGAA